MSDFIDKDRWINLSIVHEREIYDLQGKIADLGAEVERLKGYITRLRVAGDAMAERLEDDGETHPESDNWWDAKNGGTAK